VWPLFRWVVLVSKLQLGIQETARTKVQAIRRTMTAQFNLHNKFRKGWSLDRMRWLASAR
jgi:hypothetical protein